MSGRNIPVVAWQGDFESGADRRDKRAQVSVSRVCAMRKGTCAKKLPNLGIPYIMHTHIDRPCSHLAIDKMLDVTVTPTGSPTFSWSLLLRQLIFKHDVQSDTARKHITREKILYEERKPKNKQPFTAYLLVL